MKDVINMGSTRINTVVIAHIRKYVADMRRIMMTIDEVKKEMYPTDVILGLDGKFYTIIDGKLTLVNPISRDAYNSLSEKEKLNNEIYIVEEDK